MKNIIIGTAGHIDHGKTTLIKALTGRNTDRWKRSREEGSRSTLDLRILIFPEETGQVSLMCPDTRNLSTIWWLESWGWIWCCW